MPDLQLLSATAPSQLATARALLAEIERADGASPVSDQALLAAAQGSRELFLITQAGTWATAEIGGDKEVGVGEVGVGVIGEGEIDLALLPNHRGVEAEATALRLLLARTAGDVRCWVHGDRPETEAALAGAGFSPARSLYRMALDPDLLPADGVRALDLPAPAGYSLRGYGTAAGDDAAWVAVNAAAFATHPEQGRITVAQFAQMRQESWFDPEDLILLDAGSELAGSTWVKTLRGGEAGGEAVSCELYAVGVRPAHAGKGLGRLLLKATLARMAEHAPGAVTLYVDGDNTAAVGLYESARFTIDSRSRQWLRPGTGNPSVTMEP